MRNASDSKISKIITLVSSLPCFTLEDLVPVENNRSYLKILLSRYVKTGKLVRIKRGVYTAKTEPTTAQLELTANLLTEPSYLSLEYILYQYGLLTEIPINYTSIALRKTGQFKNKWGIFVYHKIKPSLFVGYKTTREHDLLIQKATKAKAVFDYLYLRKNQLNDTSSMAELRLNWDNLNSQDKRELRFYFKLEGNKKWKTLWPFGKK
ncbi:MAG: type IV toxin-antitoxin system AbiEi family antitoxin domain-containing protein [Candidatus Shapirobacteria bacterium]